MRTDAREEPDDRQITDGERMPGPADRGV